MQQLENCRVAIIPTDGVEEVELVEPRKALEQAGASTEVIAPSSGEIQGFQHHDKSSRIKVDRTLDQVSADEYDAVLLPGGAFNADEIRVDERLKRFLKRDAGVGQAVRRHLSCSLGADLRRPRQRTPAHQLHTIQDDLRNAGAEWKTARLWWRRHPPRPLQGPGR
jgi:protease I